MPATTTAVAPCPVCGSPSHPEPAFAPLPLATCDACTLTFRPSLTRVQATRALYEGGVYEQTHHDAHLDSVADEERRADARARLRFVTAHVGTRGRLLDVGAAGGAFVLEAGRAGFDASGIEPVAAFARHAREVHAIDVREGRVEDIPAASADLITLWHVLEHLPDPVGGLRAVRAGLRPGGHAIMEVPNLGSLPAAMQGTAWTHLDPQTHATHFSAGTLRATLVAAGLQPIVQVSVPHDDYLDAAQRRAPRHLAARAKLAVRGARDRRRADPWRHEFLRIVARADS